MDPIGDTPAVTRLVKVTVYEIAASHGEGTLTRHYRGESYNAFRRFQQEALRRGDFFMCLKETETKEVPVATAHWTPPQEFPL